MEQDHKVNAVQRYSEMICVGKAVQRAFEMIRVVRRHANLRAKLGQFDDAVSNFEMVLEVQESLHREIESRKEKPEYERNCVDISYNRACLLGDMANILNMKSIAEYGHDRKEDRHQTIETYQKAISSFPHNMENYENSIPKVATYHRSIGIEYGRMRLWRKSHKELKCSIDFIL